MPKLDNKIKTVIVVVFALACVPFIPGAPDHYLFFMLFLVFIYTILSQGWNLIAGYTGQISLAHHAFFGLGGYTTAMIWMKLLGGAGSYYFSPLLMILSGCVAAVFAIAIGLPLLSKLRGDYFALGTLGFGEIVRVAFVKGGAFTGGPYGIALPSSVYESLKPHYWIGLGLAAGSTLLVYLVSRSRYGLALVAIREDEMAAAANGVHVLKYKVLAFAASGFMAGVAGSLYAYYLFQVSPHGYLNLNWTLYPILMCVMGGSGTVLGPVIGAFVMTIIISAANIWLPSIHPIFTGAMIILVMLFMPNGILRLQRLQWFARR